MGLDPLGGSGPAQAAEIRVSRVRRLAEARTDMVGAFEYIGRESPESAERFLDACERTFERLARWPRMGHRREGVHRRFRRVRSFRVEGFPNYVVFYEPIENGILIVRVLHGARDFGALFDEYE